jgi:hypothetical protein
MDIPVDLCRSGSENATYLGTLCNPSVRLPDAIWFNCRKYGLLGSIPSLSLWVEWVQQPLGKWLERVIHFEH